MTNAPPVAYDFVTLDWALTRLSQVTFDWHKENLSFFDGDHWQSGQGWSGPAPSSNTEGYNTVIEEIRRGFVSKNAIREVVNRHANAVVGREPQWSLGPIRPLAEGEAPTTEEQTLIDEAEALITEWWDDRGCHRLMQEMVDMAVLTYRGALRLFVPMGRLDENGEVPVGTLQESLSNIYLSRPGVDQCTVFIDQFTMKGYGIYAFTSQNGTNQVEVCFTDGDETVLRVVERATHTGALGDTVPSQLALTSSEQAGTIGEFRYDLGGRLTIYEMQREQIVTEQVRQLQKMLNMVLSMASRNTVVGGFLERTILNAQMPGRWVTDDTSPEGRRFVPDPVKLGAGSVTFISGLEGRNADGSVTYSTPSVQYRDPVDTKTFDSTSYMAYKAILEETHQVHALLAGEAAPSGESRRQALADFVTDLRKTESRVNEAGRWLIETVLAMASLFAGQPGRYASLRATFQVRVDPGPTSTEAQALVINQRNAGFLSLETAMVRSDIDDPDAEIAKIQAEKAAEIAAQFFALRGGEAPELDSIVGPRPNEGILSTSTLPSGATMPVSTTIGVTE